MQQNDYIEDLLQRYDPDELLDIFFSSYNLTVKEFCYRFEDFIEMVKQDEAER